ncbi:CrcB family protein [Spirillospora sp. NPDC047279]|uniref:FluC/FEX family fluoride channel n=1 Tax=Spirillospora sp. NPDC047279 TaxID=3155478 RepID=UPI0033EF8CE8
MARPRTPAHTPDHPPARPARPPAPARTRTRRALILAAIAAGGGLGSTARHLIETAMPAAPGAVPWATLLINVTGCLAMGALMVGVLEAWPPSRYVRPFWGIGFLGGFTTFSTYALELRDLGGGGAWNAAAGYALGSIAAGIAAVCAGTVAARALARRRRPAGERHT